MDTKAGVPKLLIIMLLLTHSGLYKKKIFDDFRHLKYGFGGE